MRFKLVKVAVVTLSVFIVFLFAGVVYANNSSFPGTNIPLPGGVLPPELMPASVAHTPHAADAAHLSANSNLQNSGYSRPRDISQTYIPAQDHPEVNILSVEAATAQGAAYVLTASGAISRIETHFLDEYRIALDIYNAGNGLPEASALESSFIRQVRSSLTGTVPNVTRVVLDLHAAFDAGISISQDRTQVFVSFRSSSVLNISLQTQAYSDVITFSLDSPSSPQSHLLTGPRRLVVDIPANLKDAAEAAAQALGEGNFLTGTTLSYRPGLVRAVFELGAEAMVSTEVSANSILITLSPPTYRNIGFDGDTQSITIARGDYLVSAASITHSEYYMQNRYVLHLGANLSEHLGYGNFYVNDGRIGYFEIYTNSAGYTSLLFENPRIVIMEVSEDQGYVHIRARLPQEIYSHIVVIDPGHGGRDPGAVRQGLRESDIVLDISTMLIANLERQGDIRVFTTRTDDTFITLRQRVDLANEVGDVFISIHANSVPSYTSEVNGTETYYNTNSLRPGISISSYEAANIMHRNILSGVGSNDRGVRRAQFYVVTHTTIPSMLLELGFMSNPAELARLANPEYQQRFANSIYSGIREIFSNHPPVR